MGVASRLFFFLGAASVGAFLLPRAFVGMLDRKLTGPRGAHNRLMRENRAAYKAGL